MAEARRADVIFKIMEAGGALLVVAGVLVAAIFGTLTYVGPLYVALGVLLILLGLVWIYRVRSASRKLRRPAASRAGRARGAARAAAASILSLALLPAAVLGLGLAAGASPLVAVARAQYYYYSYTTTTFTPTSYCYTAYLYTTYLQYIILGFLIVATLLAFIPVILGRTPLGPVFGEFAGLSGILIVLLVFAMLFLFPINVMFTTANATSYSYYYVPPTPNNCVIDIYNLEHFGPPLLAAFLKLILGLVPAPP